MRETSRPHFVFDMDGVVIDSEPAKLAAFDQAIAEVCRPDADALRAASAYNAAHRGVPRDAKIAHVVGHILGWPADLVPVVSARYAAILAERLPACPLVRGVAAFLAAADAECHVASSAPSAEIRANLDRHVLLRHFASISGHPHAKSDVLRGLREAHPHARIVFFGDAPADLEAARAASVGFVAVNPNDELRAMVADWAADFADPGRITELVRRAG